MPALLLRTDTLIRFGALPGRHPHMPRYGLPRLVSTDGVYCCSGSGQAASARARRLGHTQLRRGHEGPGAPSEAVSARSNSCRSVESAFTAMPTTCDQLALGESGGHASPSSAAAR